MTNGRLILMCVVMSCVMVCAGQAFAPEVEPILEPVATSKTDCGECLPADTADLYQDKMVDLSDSGEVDKRDENEWLAMSLSRQLAIEHARPTRGDAIVWTVTGLCAFVAGYGYWEEDLGLTIAAGACMAGGGAMVLVF